MMTLHYVSFDRPVAKTLTSSFSYYILWGLSEQFTEIQNNVEALPGETATMITELPEAGLDVVWLKDNVSLSMTGEKYETANQDTANELIVADITVEDGRGI